MGRFIALQAGWVASTIIYGVVLKTMWAWFVLPVFVSAPALLAVPAIGVSMTVRLFSGSYALGVEIARLRGDEESAKSTAESIVLSIITPVLILGFGWVVKLFL